MKLKSWAAFYFAGYNLRVASQKDYYVQWYFNQILTESGKTMSENLQLFHILSHTVLISVLYSEDY